MSVWVDGTTGSLPPTLAAFASAPFEPGTYLVYDDVVTLAPLTVGSQSPDIASTPDSGSGASGPVCFVKGTRLLLFNQTWMPVEKIRPGMLLADATDPQHKSLVVRALHTTVTHALVKFPGTKYHGVPMKPLHVTPRHLLYDPRASQWVEAQKLGKKSTSLDDVDVYHVETTVWGACIAEGVPCETAAVDSEAKHRRTLANADAGLDME